MIGQVAIYWDKNQNYSFILNLKPTNNFKVYHSLKQTKTMNKIKGGRTKYI